MFRKILIPLFTPATFTLKSISYALTAYPLRTRSANSAVKYSIEKINPSSKSLQWSAYPCKVYWNCS